MNKMYVVLHYLSVCENVTHIIMAQGNIIGIDIFRHSLSRNINMLCRISSAKVSIHRLLHRLIECTLLNQLDNIRTFLT